MRPEAVLVASAGPGAGGPGRCWSRRGAGPEPEGQRTGRRGGRRSTLPGPEGAARRGRGRPLGPGRGDPAWVEGHRRVGGREPGSHRGSGRGGAANRGE